ncbi:MAG: hypothetical protein JSU68_09060 [Phycisphaerales bacterium]|nr:MAG: hypothetical protein JSU68_09060 [Phycisphaerales bacterium]
MSKFQRFLKGMPFVGPDRRALRNIRRQMTRRSEADLGAWKCEERVAAVRDVVSRLIQECMEWPTCYFIPDDPCDILFFEPFGDLRDVDAVVAIDEQFNLPTETLDGYWHLSFGELVDRIVKHREAQAADFS